MTKYTCRFLSCVVFAAVGIGQPDFCLAQSVDQSVQRSLGKVGLSMGTFAYEVAADQLKNAAPTGDAMKDSLRQMVTGYRDTVTEARGTFAMLDATFEVALTGTDIGTGGSSLLVTAGARWVKGKSFEYLNRQVEDEAKRVLAKNLDRLETESGMKYEQLQAAGVPAIKSAIDKIGLLEEFKGKAEDAGARAVIEGALADAVRNSKKAELDVLAQTVENTERIDDRLVGMGRQVARFSEDVKNRLESFQTSLEQTNTDIAESKVAIENLRSRMEKNADQLQALSDVTYRRASAADRLLLLKGGYLSGRIDESDRMILITATEAEDRKDRLIAQIGDYVEDFNKIGRIAQNLGVQSPELTQALQAANTANELVSDFARGDALGAVAAVTGLFGSRRDINAERHAQLMNYLKENFERVNQKLDELLDGQRQLMLGLAELSKEMAQYDKALHQRLDRMEFKVDAIQGMAFQLLYEPLGVCGYARQQIINKLGDDDTTDVRVLLTELDSSIASDVAPCVKYLNRLFFLAFDPNQLGFDPLAIKYSRSEGPTAQFLVNDARQKQFFEGSRAQAFVEGQYNPLVAFVLDRRKANRNRAPQFLASLALPSRNIDSLAKKNSQFAKNLPACAKGSLLSEPLLALLCQEDGKPTPSRASLRATAPDELEKRASLRADKILAAPLMLDPVLTLAQWSLFYAPVSDVLNGDRFYPSMKDLLISPNYNPGGPGLLVGSLQTLTVALAQMNLLYGDSTSQMLFDTVWNEQSKSFFPESALISEQQSLALKILQSGASEAGNPYLLRNVLMIALDKLSSLSRSGQKAAYGQALDWMVSGPDDSGAELQVIFGKELRFELDWQPKNSEDNPSVCKTEAKDVLAQRCFATPSVRLYGKLVPLPTPEEFAGREFTYPVLLREMVATRDRLAARLADYRAFEWSSRGSGNPKAAQAGYVNALVQVLN